MTVEWYHFSMWVEINRQSVIYAYDSMCEWITQPVFTSTFPLRLRTNFRLPVRMRSDARLTNQRPEQPAGRQRTWRRTANTNNGLISSIIPAQDFVWFVKEALFEFLDSQSGHIIIINTLYLRCLYRVFYTYDELYYEDFTCSNKRSFYRAMLCIRSTSHGSVSVCLSVCHKSEFY